ncbi:MAG: methyltransferase, partial [Polyangiaceae bacterium]
MTRGHAAARLVAESRDLLDDRPGGAGGGSARAPAVRGWESFLLSLDERELDAIEVGGTDARWPERTPETLRTFVLRARDVCGVPDLSTVDGSPARPRRGETPRKRAQIDAFGRLISAIATRARRVVDVGSGHGHLTRDLAERVGVPVVGLERDGVLAGAARRRSSGASPAFTVTDVLHDGLALSAGDCVIGLHACGELGDTMVTSVAGSPGSTLALVGCCLQKRRQPSRRPLCATPGLEDALDLPRSLLGLSNLVPGDDGVEASRADNLLARAEAGAAPAALQRSPFAVRGRDRGPQPPRGAARPVGARGPCVRDPRTVFAVERGHRRGRGVGTRGARAFAPPLGPPGSPGARPGGVRPTRPCSVPG